MSLKLMYITNSPVIAKIAENSGVDIIFIDMEYIGKDIRQGGMDTVQNHHSVNDIKIVKKAIEKAKLLVRINPMHEGSNIYSSSEAEIDKVINAGADIIMLPYFKTVDEVKSFINCVNKRVKTCLLVETPEAVNCIDDILEIDGIDQIHIGLNDLSLGYKKQFMFELLTDGTVEMLCKKFEDKKIVYGFGGIARIKEGILPAELIIKEHYRLKSEYVILSRSFCDTKHISDLKEIESIFFTGVKDIRCVEEECRHCKNYLENLRMIDKKIQLFLK